MVSPVESYSTGETSLPVAEGMPLLNSTAVSGTASAEQKKAAQLRLEHAATHELCRVLLESGEVRATMKFQEGRFEVLKIEVTGSDQEPEELARVQALFQRLFVLREQILTSAPRA